ncbi:MAG TPA: hypothetical protein VMT86_04190 [Bryobacteraceae bacterium]|nr:hypothetical protein [Bryobacteraceae bacterium]
MFPGAKPAVGVLFDSAMRRIDDVLALAMLHAYGGKGQARTAAVGVSCPDLEAAQFCDSLWAFYAGAATCTAAKAMHPPPVGLADGKPAARLPMLSQPLGKRGADGQPVYPNTIQSIEDTAEVPTLFRNALMAQYDQDAVIVLSGPATNLVQLLDMYGAKDWIMRKVRLLSVTGVGVESDAAAAQKLFAEWPTPIAMAGREIGDALPFPGEAIEKDFAWTTADPVVDAYCAYRPMPYDAPSYAMAAMLYAVHPNDGYFKLSGSGNPRQLVLDPTQKDRIVGAYVELASAKPVPRKPKHPAEEEKKNPPLAAH